MYTGELIKIQFKFWGDSLESIFYRLPTLEVIRPKEYTEEELKKDIKDLERETGEVIFMKGSTW